MKLMRTPKQVELAITSQCNLRCKYCGHFTSAGDVVDDLPKEEWLKFFTELNRLAVMNIIIQGGEPFFRKDLKDIIRGIVENRMRFSILSNGTLITDEMAQFITSTKRCDHVQVSIDGSIPFTHDSMRGEGSFFKALQGIKTLQRYKVQVGVRVTIHRKNVRELDKIAKLLLEEIGLASFGTNSASYMGLCRHNAALVCLSVEERALAMETLLRLNRIYNGRISSTAGPLAEARAWLAMERARREGKENIPGRGYLVACGGVMAKIAVRADGVITPCIQLSHIELGLINKDSLEDIWQKHPELKDLRERRDIPLSKFTYCKDCAYTNYCTGNCPALAYTLTGKVNCYSPDACLKRFLEEGGKFPDESLLMTVDNKC